MMLPETIDVSTEAVLDGVVSNGHRNGAAPECADVAPPPIDRDLLRSEIQRHLQAIGLNSAAALKEC